ncbi:LysR family transcriptional regulator [Sediminicurvatus halobius]|uniref:LysR family transcriptional regulator n=1 Tax=Sediminicurvatus halobius TaxID=2182432 RepID=A0A2U2MXA3_9GAMM|nr:LysR family transcriptional regulator [Spiribacter halobius]PWG61490.1 LysR family transcriptional regulator [Spiribacter halobius]UEX77972.1 LysR family transcriptional regulator [Spiribacter halobius]
MAWHLQPHIRYFMVVAETLHFREAARRLHVAQPALSRAIKKLEDKLEVTLLARTRRHVELTAAGWAFLEGCREAGRTMDDAEARAIQASKGELGRVVVGYTDFAISGRLPGILAAFHSRVQGANIELLRRNSHEQLDDLREGRIDIGFLTSPVPGDVFSHFPVQQDRYVAVVPDSHPLASRDSIPLSALQNESFVLGDSSAWRHFNPHIHALCLEAGFLPRVVYETGSTDSIFGLVAARVGVSIYPERELNHRRPGVRVLTLQGLERRLSTEVVWISQSANPVVQHLVSVAKEMSDTAS